jgi:YihY family inner membrane protein
MDRLKRIKAVRLVLDVNTRYGQDGGGYLAASLTYYGFLSVFPLLLLALAGVGFVLAGDAQAQREWAGRLSESIPGLGPLIGDNIQALVDRRAGAGIIGVVGLLWSGMGLTNAAGYSLSRVFRRPEVQGFVQKKVWSIAATVGLGVLALAGVAISGTAAGLQAKGAVGLGLGAVALLVSLGLDVILFGVSYRVLTAGWGPPFRRLWPGAIVAGAGWTLLKTAGAWYAARTVANASEVYGTFGSVVGILAMLYLAARLFLYGAELNAVLGEDPDDKQEGGSDMPEQRVRQSADGDAPMDQSTVALVGSIASDVGTLVRKEVELARQEIVEAITARMKAVGALGAAAVVLLVGVVFGGLAAADALGQVMPVWAARLVIAGVFLSLAGIAAGFGLVRAKRPPLEPELTKQTVKEDVAWAKAQLRR